VPHACRLASGPDHRRLLLLAGFGGAILMMVAETLCRALGPYHGAGRLPVGLLTALLGAPFFIALLRRRFAEEDA
jgi:iron complex transport system permease protein